MFLMQLGVLLAFFSIVKVGVAFAVFIGILLIIRKLILNNSTGTSIDIHDANAEWHKAESYFEEAKEHLSTAEIKVQEEEEIAKKRLTQTGDLKEEIETKKHIINK